MADPRALLIFVGGPQEGQRKALPGGIIRAGRSPTTGVQLTEDYISREQMQFTLTDDGWTIENLSSGNPTRINDKKYRKSQKVLLDTGDVIAAGLETKVLFVGPGDDAEDALNAWLGRPDEAPSPDEPRAAEVIGEADPGQPITTAPVVRTPPAQTPEPAEPEEEPEDLTEEEEEALNRKAKVKKYTILFSVYLMVIIAFFIVLNKVRPPGPVVAKGRPTELTKLDVEDVLETKIDPTPNEAASRKALAEAVRLWRAKRVDEGNLYRCIKQFKLCIAYSPSRALSDPKNARVFYEVKKELGAAVWEIYEEALRQSHAKAWRKSKILFERLLRMVPAKDHPFPEKSNRLFDNIVAHITYAQNHLTRKRTR